MCVWLAVWRHVFVKFLVVPCFQSFQTAEMRNTLILVDTVGGGPAMA